MSTLPSFAHRRRRSGPCAFWIVVLLATWAIPPVASQHCNGRHYGASADACVPCPPNTRSDPTDNLYPHDCLLRSVGETSDSWRVWIPVAELASPLTPPEFQINEITYHDNDDCKFPNIRTTINPPDYVWGLPFSSENNFDMERLAHDFRPGPGAGWTGTTAVDGGYYLGWNFPASHQVCCARVAQQTPDKWTRRIYLQVKADHLDGTFVDNFATVGIFSRSSQISYANVGGGCTDAPTRAPVITMSPTIGPTTSPSRNPTDSPTTSPTHVPSTHPTVPPTASPSTPPTVSPTFTPTQQPSHNPTSGPSVSPTPAPSDLPTLPPSPAPSKPPTLQPTDPPSRKPSEGPTHKPTEKPSHKPTEKPSHKPTHEPSLAPTDEPSHGTTPPPSDKPTDAPSNQPATGPSAPPTPSPSAQPTMPPTSTEPTTPPSSPPTRAPVVASTAEPTASPIPDFSLATLSSSVGMSVSGTFENAVSTLSLSDSSRQGLEEEVCGNVLASVTSAISCRAVLMEDDDNGRRRRRLDEEETEDLQLAFQVCLVYRTYDDNVVMAEDTCGRGGSEIVKAGTPAISEGTLSSEVVMESLDAAELLSQLQEDPSTADFFGQVDTVGAIQAVPTAAPTTEERCVDDDTRRVRIYKKTINKDKNKNRHRTCTWLASLKKAMRNWYCHNGSSENGKSVSLYCPQTCGTCHLLGNPNKKKKKKKAAQCTDSRGSKLFHYPSRRVQCSYFKGNEKREAVHCLPGSQSRRRCRKSCDNCKFRNGKKD